MTLTKAIIVVSSTDQDTIENAIVQFGVACTGKVEGDHTKVTVLQYPLGPISGVDECVAWAQSQPGYSVIATE